MNLAHAAWRARWNALRLALAALILWTFAADVPARLARIQLASLPDADYAAEVRALRARGRYAEALVVADAGAGSGQADPASRTALDVERAATVREQQSVLRRLKDLARGAITGGPGGGGGAGGADAPDPSLELLLGAVAADLFIVGDIRDLVIQSSRWARGEKPDPVIAALAGIGVVTTLAPEIDWAPSLLKAARKAGAMSERLGAFILTAVKERRIAPLRTLMTGTGAIAHAASPAGALRLLRAVDTAEDASRLGAFLARTGPRGARALSVTGADGAQLAKGVETLRSAGRVGEAAAAERVLIRAAEKGRPGAAWLGAGLARPLMRPHPLVGLAKGLWKGNVQALVTRAIESVDPFARWALPAAAAWAFFEACLLLRRFVSIPARPRPVAGRASPAGM